MSENKESAPPYRKRCRCVECLLADKDSNIEKLKESLRIEQDGYDYHKLCDENAKLKAERDEHRQSALNAIEGLRQERERTAKLQAVVEHCAAVRLCSKCAALLPHWR